ncbi:MAG TPA: hypothetical protein VH590_20805 [Ktedonobacterales bacterium]|jgi:hypothetical protein
MEEDPRIIKFRPRQGAKRRPPQGSGSGSQRWPFNDAGGDDEDVDIMAFIQQLQEEMEKPRPRGRPPRPKGGAKVIHLPLQRRPTSEQGGDDAGDQE